MWSPSPMRKCGSSPSRKTNLLAFSPISDQAGLFGTADESVQCWSSQSLEKV